MSLMKRKRRMPTFAQWQSIRVILGNGWGNGDFAEMSTPVARRQMQQAIVAFEDWLESRYRIRFTNRII